MHLSARITFSARTFEPLVDIDVNFFQLCHVPHDDVERLSPRVKIVIHVAEVDL